jgi:hypothetical protein
MAKNMPFSRSVNMPQNPQQTNQPTMTLPQHNSAQLAERNLDLGKDPNKASGQYQPRLDFSLEPEDHELKSKFVARGRMSRIIFSNHRNIGNLKLRWESLEEDKEARGNKVKTTIGSELVEHELVQALNENIDLYHVFMGVSSRLSDERERFGKLMKMFFMSQLTSRQLAL